MEESGMGEVGEEEMDMLARAYAADPKGWNEKKKREWADVMRDERDALVNQKKKQKSVNEKKKEEDKADSEEMEAKYVPPEIMQAYKGVGPKKQRTEMAKKGQPGGSSSSTATLARTATQIEKEATESEDEFEEEDTLSPEM